MNTSKKIAVVCTAILITSFAFFQNCTQTKFGSDTSTTSASSVDPTANSPTENNPISNPPVDESTNAVRKISVCQSQSCVETAEQKVFFTNQIGVSLKVKEVSRLSEKDVVVNVQNYLNGNPGRHMNVRLTLAKNGYVFARFVDGEKRHLCLDHTKAEDALINSDMNCSSSMVMVGTRQSRVELGQSFSPSLPAQSVEAQVLASNTCSLPTCFEMPESKNRLVFYDLVKTGFGLKLLAATEFHGGSAGHKRYSLQVGDATGRTLQFLVTDKSAGQAISPTADFQLFDQRYHGYVCFDPPKPGLFIRSHNDGTEILNCYSSVRYSILVPQNNGSYVVHVSGSLPFTKVDGSTANQSINAFGDTRFFENGVIPESMNFE